MSKSKQRHLTCRQPDRDCPKLICGYPLPCPYHTVVIHSEKQPPTIEIPIDSSLLKHSGQTARARLGDIAEALSDSDEE